MPASPVNAECMKPRRPTLSKSMLYPKFTCVPGLDLDSLQINKLIRIKQRPAEGAQAMRVDQPFRSLDFIGLWRASIGQRERTANLTRGVDGYFAFQPLCKALGHVEGKRVVHHRQRLERRDSCGATR